MDIILTIQIVIFFGLMVCSAFFSSSEVGLFSLNSTQLERMRQDKHPKVDLIRRMLSEPRRLIVTILIGNELVNVAASNISATVLYHLLGGEDKWWVNLLIMLPLLLLLGEITPKVLAARHNIAFASFNAPILELVAKLITPIRWIIRIVADFFITAMIGKSKKKGNIITEDMVRALATQGEEEGVLDANETEYIHNIFN
ncbi:MAG: DUF21 domain-containing protein, partial [Magnetococcales bacterium]|nr:DUF21 domain-containing protein [Magnetococcales bacterium]